MTACFSDNAILVEEDLRQHEVEVGLEVEVSEEVDISQDIKTSEEKLISQDAETSVQDETIQAENYRAIIASKSTQCDFLLPTSILSNCRIESFSNQPAVIKYYTGFLNFEHFNFFFNCLGPAAFELNYKCTLLGPKDELFLCLMKLRQAKDDEELSFFFGLSQSTVGRIFRTWLNFLYFQLKELDLWLDTEIISEHMPAQFKKSFSETKVIIDATEIPVKKPSKVLDQSATFSTYKNRNTESSGWYCPKRSCHVCF